MVWAGVTAWLSAIVMCFTVGPNWAAALNELSSYLSWFMEVTGSVYGGGVFCAVIMIGLNVGALLFLHSSSTPSTRITSRLKQTLSDSDHSKHVLRRWPYGLEYGTRACFPLLGLFVSHF